MLTDPSDRGSRLAIWVWIITALIVVVAGFGLYEGTLEPTAVVVTLMTGLSGVLTSAFLKTRGTTKRDDPDAP